MRIFFERNFYENFFWAKKKVLKTERNIAEGAIKASVIDVRITWVSIYKKLKSDTCN